MVHECRERRATGGGGAHPHRRVVDGLQWKAAAQRNKRSRGNRGHRPVQRAAGRTLRSCRQCAQRTLPTRARASQAGDVRGTHDPFEGRRNHTCSAVLTVASNSTRGSSLRPRCQTAHTCEGHGEITGRRVRCFSTRIGGAVWLGVQNGHKCAPSSGGTSRRGRRPSRAAVLRPRRHLAPGEPNKPPTIKEPPRTNE